jgi:TPR repeat protein
MEATSAADSGGPLMARALAMSGFTRAVVAVIGLAVAQAAAAQTSPNEDIAAALRRGDYATALPLIRPLAEKGDARAQFNLGVSYEHGLGVDANPAEAAKWYRLAADQNYSLAQHNLGALYEQGRGVPQDQIEALKWLRLAADRNNAFAQHRIGEFYEAGRGVPQDIVRAHMWFNLSAAQGHEPAAKNRSRLTAAMSREQIAEAQKLAREWKPAETPGTKPR